ncbi:hypothetical protein CDL15_Pgr015647 [Punica granatum]|uniref:Uncharacterized protein n=1 Tax=Punica granatum TaxID=22663 RepID=A0A218XQS1_PUNGR|nr:hypothetical protein CDL15_Pgr015647 [Punica granatum]
MIMIHDTLRDFLQLGNPLFNERSGRENSRHCKMHRQVEEEDRAELKIGLGRPETPSEYRGHIIHVEHDDREESRGEGEEEAEEGRSGQEQEDAGEEGAVEEGEEDEVQVGHH